jgi:hypothetical protein
MDQSGPIPDGLRHKLYLSRRARYGTAEDANDPAPAGPSRLTGAPGPVWSQGSTHRGRQGKGAPAAVQRRADPGARRACRLARTMSGSRASGGSGSSHQLAGRRRLLMGICFIGGPFCAAAGLEARTRRLPAGRWVFAAAGRCQRVTRHRSLREDWPANARRARHPGRARGSARPADGLGGDADAAWPCQLTAPAARAVTGRGRRGCGAVASGWAGRCGGMLWPSGSRTPVSANTTTPLQSRLHPCSG